MTCSASSHPYEMIIDVSIKYDGHNIAIKPEVANYSETKPALLALSRDRNSDFWQIEAVGYNLTTAQMEQDSWLQERDNGNRVYRVINPFLAQTFEPRLAALTVDFLCRMAHLSIEPKGLLTVFCGLEEGWKLNNLASVRSWQILLGLNKFNLTLKIADYWFVAADKKVEFEKLLRKTSRKFKIES